MFANQFCFRKSTGEFVLFDIETANLEPLSLDFLTFLKELFSDSDYYTGESLLKNWITLQNKDEFDIKNRLAPKLPFVLGGEYKIENLYEINTFERIAFSASICKQIQNIPDGGKIEIVFNNKK